MIVIAYAFAAVACHQRSDASAAINNTGNNEPPYHIISSTVHWKNARSALEELKQKLALAPSSQARSRKVSVTMNNAYTGHTISARGAMAVKSSEAVRMQLIGPAGALALDIWVTRDDAYLRIPAIDRIERGATADGPGRPTGMFRHWVLSPLAGTLLAAEKTGDYWRWWIKDPSQGISEVYYSPNQPEVRATRKSSDDEETIVVQGLPCEKVYYQSKKTGVTITLSCEPGENVPPDKAFERPE